MCVYFGYNFSSLVPVLSNYYVFDNQHFNERELARIALLVSFSSSSSGALFLIPHHLREAPPLGERHCGLVVVVVVVVLHV